MIENYIFKTEKEPYNFEAIEDKVYLRKYQPFLVFYSALDGNKAKYCLDDETAIYNTEPEFLTGGKFGANLKLSDKFSFNGKNILPLEDSGRISFWTKPVVRYGRQIIAIKPKLEFYQGDFSFKVSIDDNITQDVLINLTRPTSFKELANKVSFLMDPSIYFAEAEYDSENDELLIFTSNTQERISLLNGTDGTDLLLYTEQNYKSYGYITTEEVLLAEVGNFSFYHFTEKNVSKLKVKLFENEYIVDWNSNGIDFDNIEVDFDKTVIYIFINGKLKLCSVLEQPNTPIEKEISLYGHQNNEYCFDEFIVNSKVYHRFDFELPEAQLTEYTTEKPYIDYSFAGNNIAEGSELIMESSNNIHALISYKDQFYYYMAGSWRKSDGTYEQSNDIYTFRDRISTFPFDGENFFIRFYFASNGTAPAWIGKCYFTSLAKEDDLVGEDGETPAILVGEKEFVDDEVIELEGKTLEITTDKGKTEITFENDFTIDELIDYLNDLFPKGIAKIYKDNLGRLVLISETKGADAYIKVGGDAADELFGGNRIAQGSDPHQAEIDYSSYLEMIRKDSGAPNLIWEISDDQMLDYLKEGIEYYNRYNQGNFSTYSVKLEGNAKEGYKIPSIIRTPKDIVDIIFKPIFPLNFYAGADFGDTEDIVSLALVNSLFGGAGGARGQNIAADFYISLMAIQDFKQTLGLDPKWEILNRRIYIYPNNISRYTNVCIKYKSAISIEEAMASPEMKLYVTGRCWQTMAAIRGQYGASVQTGIFALTLNADIMFQRGTDMINQALNYWKGCDEPFMVIG